MAVGGLAVGRKDKHLFTWLGLALCAAATIADIAWVVLIPIFNR